MKTSKGIFAMLLVTGLFFASQAKSFAHCEVPCGIYGDSIRLALVNEHIETIEKAMTQINLLSKDGDKNYNQLVRWVVTKEEHAEKIQEIVSQYFLHQRIKMTEPTDVEAYAKYTYQLSLLHQISVYAMKCKQSTDLANINKIKKSVNGFDASYFGNHSHAH